MESEKVDTVPQGENTGLFVQLQTVAAHEHTEVCQQVLQELLRRVDAWDAHAAHGDTHALRTKYAKQVEEIIGEKVPVHRKINSTREDQQPCAVAGLVVDGRWLPLLELPLLLWWWVYFSAWPPSLLIP